MVCIGLKNFTSFYFISERLDQIFIGSDCMKGLDAYLMKEVELQMLLSRPSYFLLFFLATTEEAAFNRLAFAWVDWAWAQ